MCTRQQYTYMLYESSVISERCRKPNRSGVTHTDTKALLFSFSLLPLHLSSTLQSFPPALFNQNIIFDLSYSHFQSIMGISLAIYLLSTPLHLTCYIHMFWSTSSYGIYHVPTILLSHTSIYAFHPSSTTVPSHIVTATTRFQPLNRYRSRLISFLVRITFALVTALAAATSALPAVPAPKGPHGLRPGLNAACGKAGISPRRCLLTPLITI